MLTEAANRVEDIRFERGRNNPNGEYSRVVLKLDDPAMIGTDIEIGVAGTYLAKIDYDGSGVYFRFDRRHNAKVYVGEFKEAHKTFDVIYLTNSTSQSGKTLVLQVGDNAEIKTEAQKQKMYSDKLFVSTSGGVDTIAAPGVGKKIVVLGYHITETEDAALTVGQEGKLRSVGAGVYLWVGILKEETGVKNHISDISGLNIHLPENTALELVNCTDTAGEMITEAVVFYRIVGI